MELGNSIVIRELPDKRIVILTGTIYGQVPVLLFPDRKEFDKFALAVEDFQHRHQPHIAKVPDVFEQAFYTEE